MKVIALIFARGGSKGVPGKNIKMMAGKPLLAHSIDLAKRLEAIDSVYVSTDDKAIASVAVKYGAYVIDRPRKLAQDSSSEWEAWKHAIEWLDEHGIDFDVFLSLPTTAPLRNESDVISTLENLGPDIDMVLTMSTASRSPWFNMVEKEQDGLIKLLNTQKGSIHRRQDVPQCFDLNTVAYATRPQFINSANGIFDGKVMGVEIPIERSIDIDTELDFKIAEYLMQNSHETEKTC
jgi:N,N'-diacetyl-8-epilegionaminate cytidylyltransferase